jgi:hypothetical protein
MKASIITATLALAFVVPSVHAQFGNLKNAVPGMGAVSADSLLGDLNGGTDFFNKAALKYREAIDPTNKLGLENAEAKAANAKGGAQAFAFTEEGMAKFKAAAKEKAAKGEQLSEEARKLISEGNVEMGKGVAKWGLLGVAIVKAKKDGSKDDKLATVLVAAEQAVKDLPKIKELYDTMKELEKAKKNANG